MKEKEKLKTDSDLELLNALHAKDVEIETIKHENNIELQKVTEAKDSEINIMADEIESLKTDNDEKKLSILQLKERCSIFDLAIG